MARLSGACSSSAQFLTVRVRVRARVRARVKVRGGQGLG